MIRYTSIATRLFATAGLAILVGIAAARTACASDPVKIIFDTDMSGDCDDVGALAILNKFADNKEAEILACVANGLDQDKAVAASISAINTYYGRPQIPIGTYHGQGWASKSPYTAHLRDEFPHAALPDDQEPRALDVYRAALAAAPDGSVTVVSVGFLMNLDDLLRSKPDTSSPLDGVDLVRKKVKQLVVMGGGYPKSPGEYNFAAGGDGIHTQYVVENWPTPILFSGFEMGGWISTGSKLISAPAASPVRRAYELYTQFKGRASWDLTAVLAAVRDPRLYWNVVSDGYCHVLPSGADDWMPEVHRGHSYLVFKKPPGDVGKVLDDILDLPPGVPIPVHS